MFLKKRQLTPAEVIQQEQGKVLESFGLFTQLHENVTASINAIQDAKVEANKRRDSLISQIEHEEKTIALAEAEIQANQGLLTKIKEFIPQGVNE